ncbi:hypothetical protein SAMN04244579_01930 [Azotobacter beijerinckii]|uniref:Fission protein ELM1 n=2 Tax=Azotobacter beijerinckii TaxID=170623 RepID=A0A1H6TJQ7_9GAMM|nr:hypothetical protein SAMN04244579_01930 [Azotobacter beijerinckii]
MNLQANEWLARSRSIIGSPGPAVNRLDAAPGMTPVVLEARKGAPPLPEVRIFLATRPEQHRAERVFFYALQRVRNPDRRYAIYPMTALPASARSSGFGQARFAVPELAGAHGRALYNEVGQIYLGDPAELFDLPMDGHGYLATSPTDTTVMLIDCARMAACWNADARRRLSPEALQSLAASEPGRRGTLDPRWHARDLEYRPGQSRLLHYTSLPLQPWRPRPERYSYHIDPRAELFHSLELAADREGFEVHTLAQPSPGFLPACARLAKAPAAPASELCRQLPESARLQWALVGAWSTTDAGGQPAAHWSMEALRREDLPQQDVIAANGLEHLPVEDLPWLLDRLFQLGRHWVLVKAAPGPKGSAIGSLAGWRALLRRIARRYPDRNWQLDCPDALGRARRYRADVAQRTAPPRVWVLQSRTAGDYAQLLDMANALGWPYEIKRYGTRIDALAPPWPDLVLCAGRCAVPLAQGIKHQAEGRTRLVMLGRPRIPLSRFDLVISTPQHCLPLHDNVLCLSAPFIAEHPLDSEERALWKQRFAHLPRPWIALLVGGRTGSYSLDAQSARDLSLEACATVRARGGSLLVSTSPRTGSAATEALLAAIDVPSWGYRFGSGEDNPHRALLALADAFIVTGDSVAMLSEACMSGRPVAMHPLPLRRHPMQRLVNALEGWLGVFPRRDLSREQTRLERFYDWLVWMGWIVREPLYGQAHQLLGVAALPEGLERTPKLSPELFAASRARALQAIRDLMAAERPIRS